MSNRPKIPFETQKRNFDIVKKIMIEKEFELNEKYEYPVVIQKNNEIIISEVFPIIFEYDDTYNTIKVYIDMPYSKINYQANYGIYLYQNTDYEIFEHNEEFNKLLISNVDHKTTYTIFLKRFSN